MRQRRVAFSVSWALALLASASAVVGAQRAVSVEGGRIGGTIRFQATSSSGKSLSTTLFLGNDRLVRLDLDPQDDWTIVAVADASWAAPLTLRAGAAEATLRLWPAASMRLSLVAAPTLPLPDELTVRLTRGVGSKPAEGAQPREAEIACRPDERGGVACEVPEGRWDIRIKAQGFVSSYFWDRAVEHGKTLDLGRIVLRQGAAVLGRVLTEDGAADSVAVTVEVRPMVRPDAGSVGVPSGIDKLVVSTRINTWGYFLFDALAPGAYEVTARQAGFEAGTRSVLVGTEGDSELQEPIVLERALSVIARVDPPMDPEGGPWRIVLRAIRSGNVVEVAQGDASEEGEWRSPAVPQGPYSVFVVNRAGDAMARAELELTRNSQAIGVDLDLLQVLGTVRLGDEGFSGTVWFGGRHGDVRLHADSDAEGAFSLILPRPGKWKVDVFSRDPAVAAAGHEVDVKLPKPGRAAEVSIVLPDTEVRGTVRDTSGSAVAGATILLAPFGGAAGIVSGESDILGNFTIRGQAAGAYSIEARNGNGVSERVQVTLAEGLTPPDLALVVRSRRALDGKVVAWSGPVAGAWVLGIPMTAAGTLAAMMTPQGRSGLDGAFKLELPPDTASVRLVVTALGYTLAMSSLQLTGAEQTALVSLDQTEGTLELVRASAENSNSSTLPLVLVNGQPIDVPLLEHWSRAHSPNASTDQILVVTAMPPGAYSYCALAPDEALLVFAGAAVPKSSACAEGQLGAGGVLRLRQPSVP